MSIKVTRTCLELEKYRQKKTAPFVHVIVIVEKYIMADLAKEDLYAVLGVEENSDKKAILKAYRKRALKCHPDKNPDNPRAAEEFHKLSKALEILTDAAAKAAYDKLRQAKKAAELRTKALDSKRRKLKEDLEARENAAQSAASERKTKYDNKTAEEKLQAEIERLRREGSSILKQEQEAMHRQMQAGEADTSCRLRLKWNGKASKQYTESELETIFSKHGEVVTVLISAKKPGSALLELKPSWNKSYIHELGYPENPLRIILIGSDSTKSVTVEPPHTQSKLVKKIVDDSVSSATNFNEDFEAAVLGKLLAAQKVKETIIVDIPVHSNDSSGAAVLENEPVAPPVSKTPPVVSSSDPYESVAAMNARRAAERQKLIEQMMEEEDD